jgi:hypothetical protein
MTQDGGNAKQFQGTHEGIRTLPLKAVECEKFLASFEFTADEELVGCAERAIRLHHH